MFCAEVWKDIGGKFCLTIGAIDKLALEHLRLLRLGINTSESILIALKMCAQVEIL